MITIKLVCILLGKQIIQISDHSHQPSPTTSYHDDVLLLYPKHDNANLLSQLGDQVQQLKINMEFLHGSKEMLVTLFMCEILVL